MIYTKLGKSDLDVSRICMGCMGIGDPSKGMNKWAVPEEESREIIRYALEQGINFFDTAMSYQATAKKFSARFSRILQSVMIILLRQNSCRGRRRNLTEMCLDRRMWRTVSTGA